ncbi:MAG: carbohydrate porin [Succinivibrio sp.]
MQAASVLAASVLAPVANAAVTPDVALKGDASYFRAGVYSRHFNGNKGNVGRLGNEHDNYIELAPSVTLSEADGTEWRFVTSFAMSTDEENAWQSTSGKDGESITFANTQAYLRVSGLIDSDPGATIWAGKKYVRTDSHVVDNYWRNVSGNGAGIENVSLGSGKFRANWTRRDDVRNFTAKAMGYSTENAPRRTSTNMFDFSYGFSPFDGAWYDVGYTLVTPQRYAAEYSNYGYKLDAEDGKGHLFTLVLGHGLLGGWNNTVLRYVKGSTAGNGFWSHTYTSGNTDSSYNAEIINFGQVGFTENLGMIYHTWFNFGDYENYAGKSTISRDFQVVLRPYYKLTKMTRLLLEAGFSTSSASVTEKGVTTDSNSQDQKVTLAYALTPDAGNAWSRPEIRFFATYKHYGHDRHVGSWGTDFTVKNDETGKVESLCNGRKTESFFGVQAESWF